MASSDRYRLGVDVGGTFTDLLLIEEASGRTFRAKVPSTPEDSSIGVLHGIARVCEQNGIDAGLIHQVMHGTTVATNTQVLQIDRSYVPGGLGGWVIWNKRPPLAPLELTIEANERVGPRGEVIETLDEAGLRAKLSRLAAKGVEALTVSLFNAYANGAHERQVQAIAEQVMPGVPVSISSDLIPEMYEYERTETTVVNSYVRPVVAKYIRNLHAQLTARMGGVKLHVLRSDGGLSGVEAAERAPVNLLLSGPAGGVSGALWIARQAGFENLLTFDMGGTSTDVALIQHGKPQIRRETRVGDVAVRASSIDVRTVGAGGGSIAYVPDLTKALRVGPKSAGAAPGPAAYAKGGVEPTVTDANVVLGYLPSDALLGGDMKIERARAEAAVQRVADALGLPLMTAAEGIVHIVNENMFGALRLVSVERGYDPRDFALVAFGGAGPLHANALGRLMGSWPVIVPPAPGVLCAYGDATTRIRDEASQTFIRRLPETSDEEVAAALDHLATTAAASLTAEGIPADEHSVSFQIDLRYHGQGMTLTLDFEAGTFRAGGLAAVARRFDALHAQLFTFALDAPHELVSLRAVVQGRAPAVAAEPMSEGGPEPAADAVTARTRVYVSGAWLEAAIYDRTRLASGNRIVGPAIVTQMDATTLILPDHAGVVDSIGNILIRPIPAA
jgi:N-methylhydantoinase A